MGGGGRDALVLLRPGSTLHLPWELSWTHGTHVLCEQVDDRSV